MPDRTKLAELRETRDRVARLVAEDEHQAQADDHWFTNPRRRALRDRIRRLQGRIHELERELEEAA